MENSNINDANVENKSCQESEEPRAVSGELSESPELTFSRYAREALKTAAIPPSEDGEIKFSEICVGVYGLFGESGELVDGLKKHFFQGHDFDKSKVLSELGDVLWYLNYLSKALGFSLNQVAQHNISKLAKRYPTGRFRSSDSIDRAE